jgi:hypothetical protein
LSARRVAYRRNAVEAWLNEREHQRISDADETIQQSATA